MKNNMMQRWVNLTKDSPASLSMCLQVFDAIERYYEGKPYHNLYGHIDQLLTWQEEYFPDAPLDVKLAIWFHDVFNAPGFQKNEEFSAELMRFLLSHRGPSHHDLFSEEAVERAAMHILATRDHVAMTPETAVMCDLDLLSLAGTPEEYDAIASRVREEFNHYPHDWWVAGRTRFIERFLARPFIFQTERIQEWFEQAARTNLERESQRYS